MMMNTFEIASVITAMASTGTCALVYSFLHDRAAKAGRDAAWAEKKAERDADLRKDADDRRQNRIDAMQAEIDGFGTFERNVGEVYKDIDAVWALYVAHPFAKNVDRWTYGTVSSNARQLFDGKSRPFNVLRKNLDGTEVEIDVRRPMMWMFDALARLRVARLERDILREYDEMEPGRYDSAPRYVYRKRIKAAEAEVEAKRASLRVTADEVKEIFARAREAKNHA
jgi:hypothetical protein